MRKLLETIFFGAEFIYYVLGSIFALGWWIAHVILTMERASAALRRANDLVTHRSTLKGRVIPTGELLRAPLTNRECAMYDMEILRITGNAVCDKKIPDFILETDKERFFVYGLDVKINKSFDFNANDPDPKLESVLTKYGLQYYDWTVYKIVQCRERVVLPGQTITLSGSFDYIDAKPRIIRPLSGTKLTLDD